MRYFFRLTDGTNELNPHEGIELLGNAAARDEAMKFAHDIKSQKTLPGAQMAGLVRADRGPARQGDRHRAARCGAGLTCAVNSGRLLFGANIDFRMQRPVHRALVGDLEQSRALLVTEIAGHRDRTLDTVDLAFFGLALLAILRVDLGV